MRQSRSETSNDSSWASRWAMTLWSVSQIRVNHEIDQRAGFRLRSVQQMEKLIDERAVTRQREPLERPTRDRRADRPMKSRFHSVHDQAPRR